MTVRDERNSEAEPTTYESDERGGVYIPSSKFTTDDDKNVLFKLDVEAEALGYRSFGAAKVEMKLGEVRQMPMTPLSGVADNGAVSNGTGPYVYSASFDGHDIRGNNYEMIYSSLNAWDFEIKVEVRNSDGGSAPAPLLSYWAEGGSSWKWQQKWAEPTSQEGNVYTFRNKWKKILAPNVPKNQRPFIAFSKDASAEHFSTNLISVPSVVEKPVESGSDAFKGVFEKGLGFSFTIPGVNADVALNLPWQKYLPKITIDNAGFITASIGSDLFAEKLKNSKVAWQSQDMKELKQAQKNAEKEGGFANMKAQMGAAYDYYKTGGWKFLGESKFEVGWFLLLSGRKDVDEEGGESERGIIKARLASGILLKYSYSWTILHMLGPVPMYVCFTLGVNAGFAVSLEAGFSWSADDGFADWEFKPLRDITINIAFTFSAQVGAGVKGFLELYFRFTASLNFRITFVIMGSGLSSFTIGGNVSIMLGVTLLFVDISKKWGPWGGTWYDSRTNSNGIPPLQQYALANANAPEVIDAATQEPTAYAQLAPAAKAILSNEPNAHSTIRVATSYGRTYAFYIDKVEGRQRVSWVDVNTGKKDNALMHMSGRTSRSPECDDYAFDVWSDGKTIFLVGCCAKNFDEQGYPLGGETFYTQPYAYIIPLTYQDGVRGFVNILGSDYINDFDATETNVSKLDVESNPRGITNPRIEWARVSYTREGYAESIEMYGFAERVNDSSDEPGYACFIYTGGRNGLSFFSDAAVKNALGEDHERVNMHSMAKGHDIKALKINRFRCFGFVALSQPKEGVEGERAIELYDWEMNSAPVTYTLQTKPTVVATLTSTKRKAVAVKKGDIGGFELVQTVATGSDDYYQTLFYAEGETDGDGAKQYKLKGLHIGNKKGANTTSLSYDVTDYSYDVRLPSAKFYVQTVHGTPYIYWLSTVEKENDSGPDTWRLWVSIYDPATNTASSPAVYSEFTLEEGIVPRDVQLTPEGQGYLTATPTHSDGETSPEPMTLYSFPLTLKPVLTLKGMSVEDVTVAAGDFEDTAIVLMNEGNMGISTFDIEMFTREGGKVNVVETLHCDCLRPEYSSLTMQGAGQSTTLPKGRQAIFRNSDFDYTPRQRDWVLDEKKLTLTASQAGENDAWTSSLSERDSKTSFVQTNMLMPGALASFTGSLKIPENWSGDKTLYLRVSKATSNANWQEALANAAGVKGDTGIAPNAAATTELTWVLDEKSGMLVLQADELASNAAFANAVASGLIANAVKATNPVALNVSIHDIEVDHRLYEDCDGTELLDIVVSNFVDTDDSFKLSCQVYLDGSEDYSVVSLPIRDKSVASRTTQTITLPVATLVGDPAAHGSARVVISAIGRDETAYANNEFTLYLGGGNPLHFEKQPENVTAQAGEDVSFEVEVGGGNQPYTYQWQVWDPQHEKWVDLPGFTEPTLSRKNIEKKWDGCRFRCVVTDAKGTQIISQEVTLTVRDGVDTGDHSNMPLYLAVAIAALTLLWWMRRRTA